MKLVQKRDHLFSLRRSVFCRLLSTTRQNFRQLQGSFMITVIDLKMLFWFLTFNTQTYYNKPVIKEMLPKSNLADSLLTKTWSCNQKPPSPLHCTYGSEEPFEKKLLSLATRSLAPNIRTFNTPWNRKYFFAARTFLQLFSKSVPEAC